MINACNNTQRLPKQSLIAALGPDSTVAALLNRTPDDDWTVVSFDPRKQNACVRIDNGKRVVILDVFVPSVTVN